MPTDVYKNNLVVLDMLANNNWKRPIYFGVSTGTNVYIGLQPWFQLEGMAYRLVPIKNNTGMNTRVATDVMYNNVMHKFKWGNMASGVYLDENIRGMADNIRIEVLDLAQALIKENKNDSALKVINLCTDSISEASCPYTSTMVMAVYGYYELVKPGRANAIAEKMFDDNEKALYYYNSLNSISSAYYAGDIYNMQQILKRLAYLAKTFAQDELYRNFAGRLTQLQQKGLL
jgi:hypothetical protein